MLICTNDIHWFKWYLAIQIILIWAQTTFIWYPSSHLYLNPIQHGVPWFFRSMGWHCPTLFCNFNLILFKSTISDHPNFFLMKSYKFVQVIKIFFQPKKKLKNLFQNGHSSLNSWDIKVCFFGNISVFIVIKEKWKNKNWGHRLPWVGIFWSELL